MSGLHDKVLGAVLCAVLVFWCAFPVPVGVRPVDEFTHEEADAVAPAIPVIVVFGTALAAAGVYAAGASTGAYNNNLQALYNDFMRFAANEGSANAANFDSEHMESTLSGAVTSSNKVDLGVLAASGMFGLLPSFLSWNGLSGSVNVGSTSYIESSQVVTFDGVTLGTMTGKWPDNSYTQELTNYNIALSKGYVIAAYVCYTGQYNRQMRGYIWTSDAQPRIGVNGAGKLVFYNACTHYGYSGGAYGSANNGLANVINASSEVLLNADLTYQLENSRLGTSESYGGVIATSEADVINGTAAYPDAEVEAFNPTTELLESGFSKIDALDANAATTARASEAMSVDVSSILSGVGSIASLLTPVGAISAAVSAISGNWASIAAGPWAWLQNWWNTFTGYWSTLFQKIGDTPLSTLLAPLSGVATIVAALNGQGGILQWLGSTTIGDLFSSVLSGMADLSADITGALEGLEVGAPDLSGVSDAIGTAAGTLEAAVNDVNTWLGTLSGWWEGLNTWAGVDGLTLEDILAGVLSGALAGDLAGVIEAIQAAVASLVASLDGVIEAVRAPKLPDFSLAAPVVMDDSEVRRMISQKAPFAYILAVNESLSGINGTYSSTPSFYWDVNIPFAGNIRVDAGTWLNYDVHGRTIAQLLKLSFNAFVIVMLLGFVYKAMQRAI